MKTILTIFSLLCAFSLNAQQFTVGSYNLRQQNDWDQKNGNGWERRSPIATDLIEFIEPDIFGTQEMFAWQLADLLKLLPEYSYIGRERDGDGNGEHSAIFYRRDKLRPVRSSSFWLSETPDTVSRGWDAACNRICTWGEFVDIASSDTIYFFNLHMDHVGVAARRNGAKLVVERIAEIVPNTQTAAIVLTGDFNVDQTDEIYDIFINSGFLNDSYEVAQRRFATNGTFNNYNSDTFTHSRIDHVFISPALTARRYGVLTDAYWVVDENATKHKAGAAPAEIDFQKQERRLPSDHYPVWVKVEKR